MTGFLLKIFVKDYTKTTSSRVRAAYGRLSGAVGIVCNVLLCLIKFPAGILCGSAALISDAANNLADVASCVVSLIGFKLASKPADEEHPFGHGRYEYILSVVISFFVLLMGAELLKSSVSRIVQPQPVQYPLPAIVVIAVSICVKLWMGIFNRKLATTGDIPALKATSVDSFSDCISTGAVLVSVLLHRFFSWNVDAYIGAAVALFIIWNGIGVLKTGLQPLIGKPAQKELVEALSEWIVGFDGQILGVHDLILHDYGMGKIFAVADVEVPSNGSLVELHRVVDRLEKSVEERFSIHLVLHMDPVNIADKQLRELQEKVKTIVRAVDEHYTIHDFHLSEDGGQMFFDLVIDSDIGAGSDDIGEMVKLRILSTLGEAIEPVIKTEFSYTQK